VIKPPLLAIGLMLFPVTASAECPWVLWASGISNGRPISAMPVESFTTLRECREAEKRLSKPRNPNTGDLTNAVCLPDTVDPREAKGK
jgi:hypothetical protein